MVNERRRASQTIRAEGAKVALAPLFARACSRIHLLLHILTPSSNHTKWYDFGDIQLTTFPVQMRTFAPETALPQEFSVIAADARGAPRP
jgi:hypothetical protein